MCNNPGLKSFELRKKSLFVLQNPGKVESGKRSINIQLLSPDTLMDARLWLPRDQNIRRKFDTDSIRAPWGRGSHRELYQKLTATAFNFENHLICFNLFKTKLDKSKEISKLRKGGVTMPEKYRFKLSKQTCFFCTEINGIFYRIIWFLISLSEI